MSTPTPQPSASLTAQTVSPSASPSATASMTSGTTSATNNSSAVSSPILWAALVALLGVLLTATVQWLIGWRNRRQAADIAADALIETRRNVEAAGLSASSAKEAVALNREISTALAMRAELDTRLKRYQDAAAQLGHDKAPVRLAGVYALASLADEWSEHRQACIEILCAYLRMPVNRPEQSDALDGSDEASEDLHVRDSIERTICAHLRADAAVTWSDMRFNFNSAALNSMALNGAVFHTKPDFRMAAFLASSSMLDVVLGDGLDMRGAKIDGAFELAPSMVRGHMDMSGATIARRGRVAVQYMGLDDSATFSFEGMNVAGSLSIRIDGQNSISSRRIVSMDAINVYDGEVSVSIGSPNSPTTLYLQARNWTVTGSRLLEVRSVDGEGAEPQVSPGMAVWNLNWKN